MKTYRIHFTRQDGSTDCIVVKGQTIGEVQDKALVEVKQRHGRDAWSEEIKPSPYN